MNHVRFHSWVSSRSGNLWQEMNWECICKPNYPCGLRMLANILPGADFFEKRCMLILDAYGKSSFFILMCNGNENEGDFAVLEDLVKKAQTYDNPSSLFCIYGSYSYRFRSILCVTCYSKGWITVYEGTPSTDWDRNKESDIDVPVIKHMKPGSVVCIPILMRSGNIRVYSKR